MTREEAIRLLSGLMFKGKLKEALDMAIKALEQEDVTWIVGNDNVQIAVRNMPVDMMQKINAIIGNLQEPTTKNDLGVDAVSRQAAIDAIRRIHPIDTDYDCTLYDKVDVMYVLNDLPSVTPQPKHGIWQQINKNEVNVIPEYRCSECGAEYKGFGFDFDYCPRCGCAMEEEE